MRGLQELWDFSSSPVPFCPGILPVSHGCRCPAGDPTVPSSGALLLSLSPPQPQICQNIPLAPLQLDPSLSTFSVPTCCHGHLLLWHWYLVAPSPWAVSGTGGGNPLTEL